VLCRRVEQDPGDEEARRQLDEIQRMEAVQENMMSAMEHHPEAFGQVPARVSFAMKRNDPATASHHASGLLAAQTMHAFPH
jgi:hypothetical protein